MDLLPTASAFATFVGLLNDFLAQRQQTKVEDYQDFLAWLSEHRHDEVVQLLSQQSRTVISIKALLSRNREEVLGRLGDLDRTLAAVASSIEELASVAEAVYPGVALSDQALDILKQYRGAGASKATRLQTVGEVGVLFLDGSGGMLRISDVRFLEDDLQTLVDAGLLRLSFGQDGNLTYVYTRRGDAVVSMRSRT